MLEGTAMGIGSCRVAHDNLYTTIGAKICLLALPTIVVPNAVRILLIELQRKEVVNKRYASIQYVVHFISHHDVNIRGR